MNIASKKSKIEMIVAKACAIAWEMGDKAPAVMSIEVQEKSNLDAKKTVEDTVEEILKVV